jgi:hypothetical protein
MFFASGSEFIVSSLLPGGDSFLVLLFGFTGLRCRWIRGFQLDQVVHCQRSSQRKQLLIHRVKQPPEGCDYEDEPMVAVEFLVPWSGRF